MAPYSILNLMKGSELRFKWEGYRQIVKQSKGLDAQGDVLFKGMEVRSAHDRRCARAMVLVSVSLQRTYWVEFQTAQVQDFSAHGGEHHGGEPEEWPARPYELGPVNIELKAKLNRAVHP